MELRYEIVGKNAHVYGDGQADFSVVLRGVTALKGDDFLL
jgi:hypothetical protein